MKNLQEFQDELEAALHSTRLLVFLEKEPLSNEYSQVMLDPEQFKHFSFSLGKIVARHDPSDPRKIDKVAVDITPETFKLPDLPQIYEKKD